MYTYIQCITAHIVVYIHWTHTYVHMNIPACTTCVCYTLYVMETGSCPEMHSYLQSDPFKSNQLLQSYAGLFNYILWRCAVEENPPLPTEQGEDSQGHVMKEERRGRAAKGEEEEGEEELMEEVTFLTATGMNRKWGW